MTQTNALPESKIDATHRLQKDGRWAEASIFRDQVRQQLKSEGMKRAEANETAWERMIAQFPPLQAVKSANWTHEIDEDDEFYTGEVMNGLPLTAEPNIELAWIRSHPAMYRYFRREDLDETFLLTNEDIFHASNGPAPSRSAVNALQYWANNPDYFFSQLLTVQKKSGQAAGTPPVQVEDEVEYDRDDFDRILAEMADSASRNSSTVGP